MSRPTVLATTAAFIGGIGGIALLMKRRAGDAKHLEAPKERASTDEHPSKKCPFQFIIKATAPVVAPKVREIVDDFYPRMFKNNPEAQAFFNPANQFEEPPRQRMALANAVCAYATNIDNLGALTGAVKIIAHKHCALNVQPPHYQIVHDNLMEQTGAAVLLSEGVPALLLDDAPTALAM